MKKLIPGIKPKNYDPISSICSTFSKQIAELSAFIEGKQEEVSKDIAAMVEIRNRINAAHAEIERATKVRENIEGIIEKTA